jgi:hypothetical protein
MANKRIIDLTAAVGLAVTDVFEIDTGVASFRITAQQLYNLMIALLAVQNPLNLSNVNVNGVLSALGTSVFSAPMFANFDLEILNQNKGVILASRPSGIRYRLVFDDAGQIGTEPA